MLRIHPRRGPVRSRAAPSGVVVLVLALLLGSLLGSAGVVSAQPAQPPTATPVTSIHFQDLTPTDSATIEVFLARPNLDRWDGVTLMSSEECAELGPLGDPGPDHVLVLEVTLLGSNGPLAQGETCATTIEATYRAGDAEWSSTTLLNVTRLAHPPLAPDALMATLTVDRVGLPGASGTVARSTALFLTLTNGGEAPIELLGLADPTGFEAIVGTVHQSDTPLFGTLEQIQDASHAPAPTTLAPGASTHLALVLDPHSRLPDGSGVITVQPALLVRIDDTTYSLRFERLSTAWGNELP